MRQFMTLLLTVVGIGAAWTAAANDFGDSEATSYRFVYGVDDATYTATWNKAKTDGFVPIDIETDRNGSRFSGVWQDNSDNRKWVSWRNLTSDAFHEKWSEFRDKGFRPIDQDAEVVAGDIRYSLVMVENLEGIRWRSTRNLTSQQFSEKFEENKNGFRVIDVDAVEHRDGMLFSAIWVENDNAKAWALKRNMSPEQYGDNFDKFRSDGFRVVDIDCYLRNGKLNFAAVWEKNEAGRGWAAVRGLTANAMENRWRRMHDRGMRITDIEMCPAPSGSGHRYAAVWRENASRFDWQGRAAAEKALKEYAAADDVPGVGAAIIRNSRVLFQGGAGFADIENDRRAHAGTIFRLGSVAKAVTGVLAYDLEEAGRVDLDDRTDSHVQGLGSRHNHTVRQLLENRSCVEHYIQQSVENDTQVQYDTAREALDEHLDGRIKTNAWLVPGCSPGDYDYSTHGYTIAGAAIEAMTGRSFAGLVQRRISRPQGLDTLAVETRTSPEANGNRARLYSNVNPISAANFQNTSWKAGGGGMEGSALDVARFGDAVVRDQYFPRSTRNDLWPSNSDGENGSAAGWRYVVAERQASKVGGQQGTHAHIRIDVEAGITVVAMTNTSTPNVGTGKLTGALMDIARQVEGVN